MIESYSIGCNKYQNYVFMKSVDDLLHFYWPSNSLLYRQNSLGHSSKNTEPKILKKYIFTPFMIVKKPQT